MFYLGYLDLPVAGGMLGPVIDHCDFRAVKRKRKGKQRERRRKYSYRVTITTRKLDREIESMAANGFLKQASSPSYMIFILYSLISAHIFCSCFIIYLFLSACIFHIVY